MYRSMQQTRLLVLARPCRFVARRRYPALLSAPSRQFHRSRIVLSSPPQGSHDNGSAAPENPSEEGPSPNSEGDILNDAPLAAPPSAEQSIRLGSRPYGSAVRRAMRNRKPSRQYSPPAATVPNWFHERNTVTYNTHNPAAAQSQHQVGIAKSEAGTGDTAGSQTSGGDRGDPSSTDPPTPDNRYAVAESSWEGLRASVKAGLQLPPAKYAKEPSANRSHLVLQYPGSDGILFLDAVVKRLTHELSTDLVTLNAQDIAQLFSEQDLAELGMTSPIRSLGYDVYRPAFGPGRPEQESTEIEDEEDMSESSGLPRDISAAINTPRIITIEGRGSGDIRLPSLFGLKSLMAPSMNGASDHEPGQEMSRQTGQRIEHRWSRLVNELLSSSDRSQPPSSSEQETETPAGGATPPPSHDLIVHVQDYRDIQGTEEGAKFISLLQKAIQDRREAGSKILLIGTVSEEPQPFLFDDHSSKPLLITPAMGAKAAEKTFMEDQKKRTRDINIRHLQSMLRFRLNEQDSPVEDDVFGDRVWPLDASTINESGLESRYWTYSQVHWIANLALGCVEANETFGFQHITRGIELMTKGDQITKEWLQEKSPKSKESGAAQTREQLLSSLRKTCNTHEKKLLNGVVDAKSIRTTFEDVHVPSETIDALKTLTSLSLIRPEAFTYGVLATDKIPGLLLYGPPGTGKTLLAKAVARESGATVLEVSGSEVYDMYVGEGEKNVKAIFTLAKKLSPCVVFIDEADAIFCSRTGASSRTSHRELINQFLREWDGMNDLSAFIMVATNRPFDLDDAVLRRLPRRLLVDLPTEEDRLAILKIHLKEEQIDPSVDFAELARQTPLYSGSDLKNLSVAAALACVREENDAAVQHQGNEPYSYPERRTLTRAHFEKGMEEISASISEDMSSLSAIRKFDEQYGDRKGRRQKSSGWGFMPAIGEEKVDSARVRT
ncbi:uncharacterized protein PFLUO_LOCUS2446 [Penicillium psychrofluorescens]|uniref:uncharacterized protein n=1 Tax=Penicillium psychrofluorescens TaxID=3158075 RepID=UPI003CCD1C3C